MSEDNEREECFYPELLLKDVYRSCSTTSTTFKFQDTGPHTITCHLTQLTSDMQSCRFPDIQNGSGYVPEKDYPTVSYRFLSTV